MGIAKPVDLKSNPKEGENVNQLFVGIDVGSRDNAVYIMLPDGSNRFLKYYLVEAANSLVRCDTEYKRFYDLKYKEVNKYQHKRALALTARKLVRLVFRLLKDNRLYRPA